MTKADRERLLRGSRLFEGWSVTDVFGAIRGTFLADRNKMTAILAPAFKDQMHKLQRKWDNGVWSFGYCFYIAEVAELMFLSACPAQDFKLKSVGSGKKLRTRVPSELKKHYVLFFGERCFDPERGPEEPQRAFRNVKGERFPPQHPTINATLLLAWVAQHCETTQHPARISLAALRPALSELSRRWKQGGTKSALKDQVRVLAGLPPV